MAAYIQQVLAVVGKGSKVFDGSHALLNIDVTPSCQVEQAVYWVCVPCKHAIPGPQPCTREIIASGCNGEVGEGDGGIAAPSTRAARMPSPDKQVRTSALAML